MLFTIPIQSASMQLVTNLLWLAQFCVFTLVLTSRATAQVIPDTSLPIPSRSKLNGTIFLIDQGTNVGNNLFHSFEQFSVPTSATVQFNNSPTIQNIVSRVTGTSVSNIDGLIRANGTSNLFLLNPNGIIFGPNAALQVGGSVLFSTADRLHFEDGTQLSTSRTQSPPLLTVSTPVGVEFNGNPGPIQVQNSGHNLATPNLIFFPLSNQSQPPGLQVVPGQTLALVGGDLIFTGGIVAASGGRIELGSVDSGFVQLNPINTGWSLNYEDVAAFRTVQLDQTSLVNASGLGTGSIQIYGADVAFHDGSVALIQTQGFQPGGPININATETLRVSGTSADGTIPSSVVNETVNLGGSGDIVMTANQLIVENGGAIAARTFTPAPGGNIVVTADQSLAVLGFSPLNPFVFSVIATETAGTGPAGDLILTTPLLTVQDGGNIGTATLSTGKGGDLNLTADVINLSGVAPTTIRSTVFANTGSEGDGGAVTINTSQLSVTDGAVISSSTTASGDAGAVTINATEFVEVSGEIPSLPFTVSTVFSAAVAETPFFQAFFQLPEVATGRAGAVTINTKNLFVRNGGRIATTNSGPATRGN